MVLAAMLHDASEILTGDLPTPIKYYDPNIRDAYKKVEELGCRKLLSMLPPELQSEYEELLLEKDENVRVIVKAADKLSAYIKCMDELKAGNREFEAAARQTKKALEEMNLPCLNWFMEHCLESFEKNLDELDISM